MKLTVSLNAPFLCPFQAFVDMAKALSSSPALPKMVFTPVSELSTINDWINLESLGQPTAIRAQALSLKLQALLRENGVETLELHVQTAKGLLSKDNLYLFLFLNRLVSLRFIFYVDAKHLEDLKQVLTVAQDALDWDIRYQTEPAGSMEPEDNQAVLKAMGFDFSFEYDAALTEADVQRLIGYAWVCLKAGAPEAGSRALTDVLARDNLSTLQQESLLMHLLLTRFLAHQYEDVTAFTLPQEFLSLSKEDVTSLHFIKAYSATLTRNLVVAEHHFKACQVHEDMPLSDENSLYRLNLYALFLVLKGQEETALTLEMRIKKYIEDHQITVAGLKYVNYINIARLYKKAKQFEQALAYYELAYHEIGGGGYTVYDQIYYHMNLGAVYEAKGDYDNALYFWINATMYWLACENPYALSWRPRLILAQEKITDILKPLPVGKADDFLYAKIEQLLYQCGMVISTDCAVPYMFTTEKVATEACYIDRNRMIYASASAMSPSRLSSARQRVQALVSNVLKQTLAIQEHHTLLCVDIVQEGFDVFSAEQAFVMAALKGCHTCYFEGRLLSFSQEKKEALLNEVQVFLTPAIQSLETKGNTYDLKYHRSFLNKRLSDAEECTLVERLKAEKRLYYQQLNANERAAFDRLIEKKVVVFQRDPRSGLVAKKACVEASL